MKIRSILASLVVAMSSGYAGAAAAHDVSETVKPNVSRVLPNIPGKSLTAVEVVYPPGGTSQPHTHAKSAFIYAYVVSGSVVSKVNNEPEHVYKAGESFFEEPGSLHAVSRNASKTKPAKLLAVFVVDSDDKQLTTNVK
ncbi:cupin domain-containing protein [Paraburkholderia sp. Cpub6]|uniref:cupin domain-containing protein n=1 Tax=Paraburkholderia sp. Cpub6 TaxID=2723094 RepID=UPI0016154FC0|nr:cupin domain-containing protein [Paraburkholderia sp. Cpub6]MBB5462275.1 quercetin dioxygenase-like cupin family protein [Paraburkholderia sp. Cpub6]